jgi:hypothetical protein
MQEQGYSTEQQSPNKTAREATLNERLNRAGDQIASQCDRIESALSRAHGTPARDAVVGGSAPTPIRPTQSLAQMVENMEALAKRISELRGGVERIA